MNNAISLASFTCVLAVVRFQNLTDPHKEQARMTKFFNNFQTLPS